MSTHLPPQDPIEPDDALPGEAELSALYRQLPREEPGPTLDAAVLRAAAAAIASETHQNQPRADAQTLAAKPAAATDSSRVVIPIGKTRPGKAPRWLVGLASAATLVLVAGVTWRMRELPSGAPTAADTAVYNADPPAAATAAPAARENAPMAPLASAVVPQQENLGVSAVRAIQAKNERANPGDTNVVARAQRKPHHVVPPTALVTPSRATSMPPPVEEISSSAQASASRQAYTLANPAPLQTAEQLPAAPSPPAPIVENAIASGAKTMAPPPAAMPSSSPPAPAPAPPAPAAAIAGVPANASSVALAAPPREHVVVNAKRPVVMPMRMPAPMPAMPAPPTPPAPAPAPSTSPIDTTKQPDDTPAQELAKITALFAQHDDAEAQRRLLQFHRDHPTWHLDPSLRARLGEP
ncbi:hypothetical protein [Rhodanobacter sp. BL-MT-08]